MKTESQNWKKMIKYNSNVVERHNCRKWRPTALKHSNQLVWELALQAAGGEPLRWRAACCFFVHRSIVLKCCVQPRSFDHFHFGLVKLTVSKFCLKETLTPKLNEMFASADYQATVGFVFGVLRSLFGCRRRATPICNSDQAAVGFGFKCRREATGKSAADEGNEPFRHPSKSFCALDVE